MEVLTKKLGKGEVNWKGVVVPRGQKSFFPQPGVEFEVTDRNTSFRVKLDKQYRLRLSPWFQQHPNVKAGDRVSFTKENGKIRLSFSKDLSEPEEGVLNWAHEVLDAIKVGDVRGRIVANQNGFSVEIGDNITQTQITIAT